jgi:hypothetical protein
MLPRYAESLSTYIGIQAMILCICFAAHILSCLWYVIGLDSQVIPGVADPVQGWVASQDWEDADKVPVATKYTTALYTVFNALETANTDSEKWYAVMAELVYVLVHPVCDRRSIAESSCMIGWRSQGWLYLRCIGRSDDPDHGIAQGQRPRVSTQAPRFVKHQFNSLAARKKQLDRTIVCRR